MGMFVNAIQNLSQLAIQESGVTIPETANDSLVDDVKARLDSMTALTEEEMYVPAESVTVKASNRLHKYLIEAEEISHFMITNGLTNFKEAVGYILEAHDLEGEYHNVAIVIDEDSILDEMDSLGYVVSDFNLQTPPKGLGLAMVGKQKDFAKIRNIANTKELMDLLTGRYGLPLVKRNYTNVGLLNRSVHHEAVEDAQLKPTKDAKILHEEDPKKKQEPVDEGVILNKLKYGLKTGAKIAAGAALGYGVGRGLGALSKRKGFKEISNTTRYVDPSEVPADVRAKLGEESEIQEGYVDNAREAGYKIKKKFQNATSSAADALRNKLGQAREVVSQATNNVRQKLNIDAANESMDPHQAHLQWLREVAAGMHNDEY